MKEEEEFDENAITAVGDDVEDKDKDKEEKKEKVLVVKASVVAGMTQLLQHFDLTSNQFTLLLLSILLYFLSCSLSLFSLFYSYAFLLLHSFSLF